MKGELLPQAEKTDGDTEHTYRSFSPTKEDMDFKVMSSEHHEEASAQITTAEVTYSGNVALQAQILPKYITSSQNITGKATLQVPQVVIQKQRLSDDSFSSSPVEIRITAATPVPEMAEDVSEHVSPAEKTSEVPTDDSTSQINIYEEGAVDFVTQEHDDLKIAFEVTEMPPRFINPICDMEAHEGTTVMFECSLMGIPSPIISWFKGDKKIPHNKKFILSSDGDNHFLKICKITSQDSGVYTCRAINVVGETLCRASLVVLSAKAFAGKTRGRELTAVSLGSAKQVSEIELEFEFEQEADESQRAVRLVANTDKETSEQGEKYVSINFDVFAEPAKDEKIEFKGKSSEMCSFHFQITETAPKCVIPLTNVTAAVGTPVILQCLVSGKPSPTAEWYKDGELVTDSRCIIQEKTAGHFNLLITNVTQSDAGEYKCQIQNSSGSIETTRSLSCRLLGKRSQK
uniref:Ig-like domain-containing protein n=1 Tax=Periophthalmus magnuspinnatus TaxID=409849 RepID=A0A3B3ZPW2_9GOBI